MAERWEEVTAPTWCHFSSHLCHILHLNRTGTPVCSETRGAHTCRPKSVWGTSPNGPWRWLSSKSLKDWGPQGRRISASRLPHQLLSGSPGCPPPTLPWRRPICRAYKRTYLLLKNQPDISTHPSPPYRFIIKPIYLYSMVRAVWGVFFFNFLKFQRKIKNYFLNSSVVYRVIFISGVQHSLVNNSRKCRLKPLHLFHSLPHPPPIW